MKKNGFLRVAKCVVIVVLMITGSLAGIAQVAVSMQDVETRREVAMANADGKSTDGIYRYYAKGDDKPFTGVLFAKYANGNYSSWQEYKDGIGQGKWINYYENGNYKEVGNYEQNRVEGPIRKYYEDGQLKYVLVNLLFLRYLRVFFSFCIVLM